jgi:RNA polymerase-binding transcription factor DksA
MSDSGGSPETDRSEVPSGDPVAVRTVLDEARHHLVAQVHELGVDGDASSMDENFADSAAVSAEQGEQQALAADLQEQLDDVEKALARLDDGTYGTCEVCGVRIGASRLEALPATRFCIDHAG